LPDFRLGYYYLHEESVIEEDGEAHVTLCEDCFESLKKGDIPQKAIARGFDFGRPDRVTPALESLEIIERFAISSIVPYQIVLKLGRGNGMCSVQSLNTFNNFIRITQHLSIVD